MVEELLNGALRELMNRANSGDERARSQYVKLFEYMRSHNDTIHPELVQYYQKQRPDERIPIEVYEIRDDMR